jgi:hypothetical protein
MTYFSNEPEPEKVSQPAAAPKNKILSNFLETDSVSLQRRPSKLSPADRLSRPRPTSTFVASGQTTPYPQGPQPQSPQPSYRPSVPQQLLPNHGGRPPLTPTPSYVASPLSRWDPPPPQSDSDKHESSLPVSLATWRR